MTDSHNSWDILQKRARGFLFSFYLFNFCFGWISKRKWSISFAFRVDDWCAHTQRTMIFRFFMLDFQSISRFNNSIRLNFCEWNWFNTCMFNKHCLYKIEFSLLTLKEEAAWYHGISQTNSINRKENLHVFAQPIFIDGIDLNITHSMPHQMPWCFSVHKLNVCGTISERKKQIFIFFFNHFFRRNKKFRISTPINTCSVS